MSIKDYMDDLEDLLDQAHPIPFVSHKVIIDGERMQELINAARQDIPSEISRAKAINDECDQVIERAKLKAERIIQEAEIRAKAMISQQEILKEVKKRAMDMVTKAQSGSNNVKVAAENYVNDILTDVESSLVNTLKEVRETKTKIANRKK